MMVSADKLGGWGEGARKHQPRRIDLYSDSFDGHTVLFAPRMQTGGPSIALAWLFGICRLRDRKFKSCRPD